MAASINRQQSRNSGPYSEALAVVPHNTNELTYVTRAIYVGVAGDVKVNLYGSGTGIVFKAVPVGILPIRATLVASTGTTATNIVALW